jgi:diguanylate cyclase (GGDEF)-like protein
VHPRYDRPGVLRTTFAVLAVAAIAVVGLLDYVTGPWLSFAVFYVAPVLAAAWWLGRGPALLASLAAGIVWFEAEAWGHRGEPNRTLLWNSMSRLLMLVAMAAMVVRIREDRRRLQLVNARLSDLLHGAEKLARTDPLTALPNRRAFIERLSAELSHARRVNAPVCIAYIDIDNFKRINDEKGHVEGDDFLKKMGLAIRETIRESDVAARLGGDEFAVLFTDAKRSAVEPLAHRLHARTRALGDRYPGLDVGASVGMAWFETPPEAPELLLDRADGAMYEAKAAGKHRFALWAGDSAGPVLQS